MSDDVFWSGVKGSSESLDGRSYSEITAGGEVRSRMYTPSTKTTQAKGTRFTSVKLAAQPAYRLSAPFRGGLTMRSAERKYKVTGFRARPAKALTMGAARLQYNQFAVSAGKLPKTFCYAPNELTSVRDQKDCGCCWAVAATGMLADRVSVKGGPRCALSVVQMMQCADYSEGTSPVGCEGNDPFSAMQSIKTKGSVLRSDADYPGGDDYTKSTTTSDCNSDDVSDSAYGVTISDLYMVTKDPTVAGEIDDDIMKSNVENMKTALYQNGPLLAVFAVPSDFQDYDGTTIYTAPKGFDPNSDSAQWHAVELVGWGENYWICKNSWGEEWPVTRKECAGRGFFYIAMETNGCSFENYVAAAIPETVNKKKAKQTPDDTYKGCGGPTGSFFGRQVIGPVTVGEIAIGGAVLVVVAVVAGVLISKHKNK